MTEYRLYRIITKQIVTIVNPKRWKILISGVATIYSLKYSLIKKNKKVARTQGNSTKRQKDMKLKDELPRSVVVVEVV